MPFPIHWAFLYSFYFFILLQFHAQICSFMCCKKIFAAFKEAIMKLHALCSYCFLYCFYPFYPFTFSFSNMYNCAILGWKSSIWASLEDESLLQWKQVSERKIVKWNSPCAFLIMLCSCKLGSILIFFVHCHQGVETGAVYHSPYVLYLGWQLEKATVTPLSPLFYNFKQTFHVQYDCIRCSQSKAISGVNILIMKWGLYINIYKIYNVIHDINMKYIM